MTTFLSMAVDSRRVTIVLLRSSWPLKPVFATSGCRLGARPSPHGLSGHLHVACPKGPAELGPLSRRVPPDQGSGVMEVSQRTKIEGLGPERDSWL